MTTIILTTEIKAPIKKVFDLSRDIDFHQKSASQTKETAIDGVTSGIINLGETVKWKGKHFGLWLTHESLITKCVSPSLFIDEMTQGHFKKFKHNHYFKQNKPNHTIVTDILTYMIPYGILGRIIDKLLIKNYLKKFLIKRNNALKVFLEREEK